MAPRTPRSSCPLISLGAFALALASGALGACSEPAASTAPTSSAGGSTPSGAAWREVAEEGVFKISFPGEPKRVTTPKPGGESTELTAWEGDNFYTLRRSVDPVYKGLSSGSAVTVVDGAARAKAKSYESNEGGRVVACGPSTLGGSPATACEVAVERPMKGTNHLRIAILGGDYYDATVFIADGGRGDEHARFFASFVPVATVTGP